MFKKIKNYACQLLFRLTQYWYFNSSHNKLYSRWPIFTGNKWEVFNGVEWEEVPPPPFVYDPLTKKYNIVMMSISTFREKMVIKSYV